MFVLLFLFVLQAKPNGTVCPVIFDSVLCWPQTSAGTLAILPCFNEFKGMKYDSSRKSNQQIYNFVIKISIERLSIKLSDWISLRPQKMPHAIVIQMVHGKMRILINANIWAKQRWCTNSRQASIYHFTFIAWATFWVWYRWVWDWAFSSISSKYSHSFTVFNCSKTESIAFGILGIDYMHFVDDVKANRLTVMVIYSAEIYDACGTQYTQIYF